MNGSLYDFLKNKTPKNVIIIILSQWATLNILIEALTSLNDLLTYRNSKVILEVLET